MDGPLYMDAVITPHRSLSRRGFVVLIGVLTAINGVTAAVFVANGAGLAPAFLSLDILALAVAIAISNRAATQRERVVVTAAEVQVVLETRRGVQRIWTSPTAFTRVAVLGDAEDACDLRLRLSDREIAVARALRRSERLDFARALDRAILRARARDAAA